MSNFSNAVSVNRGSNIKMSFLKGRRDTIIRKFENDLNQNQGSVDQEKPEDTLKVVDKDDIYKFFKHYNQPEFSQEKIKDNLILLSISLM